MLLLVVFCLVLTGIAYYTERTILHPTFLGTITWGGVFFIFSTTTHGIYEVSYFTQLVIAAWIFCFYIAAWFFSKVKLEPAQYNGFVNHDIDGNKFFIDLFFYISILSLIPISYYAYINVFKSGIINVFHALRYVNNNVTEENVYGPFVYAYAVAYVSYIVEFINICNHKSRIRFIVILLVNLLLSVITMAKEPFLHLLLVPIVITLFKRRLSLKYYVIPLVILFVLFILIQTLRTGNEAQNAIDVMFKVYTLGGVSAFDQIVLSNMRSEEFGQFTLSFFTRIFEKLFGIQPENVGMMNDATMDGYFFVPYPTNVSTVLSQFWFDYGILGIMFFGLLLGGLSGYLYKKAIRGYQWSKVLYCLFAFEMILQFYHDYIILNLSYTLQVLILSLLIYNTKWKVKFKLNLER